MNATSPIKLQDAIIYQGKALKVWEEKNEIEQLGNSLAASSRILAMV